MESEHLETPEAVPITRGIETAPSGVRMRLLIVDDEPLILWSLKQGLAGRYDVVTAPGPREALHVLRREPFDGLLTDFLMEGMDGIDLAMEARRLHPGIRLFLMTAFGTRDLSRNAASAGFSGYLDKPFQIQKVRDLLTSGLGRG